MHTSSSSQGVIPSGSPVRTLVLGAMRCHSGKGSYTCSSPFRIHNQEILITTKKVFSFQFSFLADFFFLFLSGAQDKSWQWYSTTPHACFLKK